MKYTVTGATGHLGRLVTNNLVRLAGTQSLRATVHTLTKADDLRKQGVEVVKADYLNVETMVRAFMGIDVLVYIPSKTYSVLQRITEFENTLTAMKQAGVAEMVFVSFYADQENNPFTMSSYYGYVPRRLAGAGVKYAVIKNSLYADPLVPYLPELIERGNLIYPVGNQALSFITQADSAEAIANLAVKQQLRNQGQSYVVTQSENYQMAALGQIMTNVTGQRIGYAPVSVEKFGQIYAAEGDGTELASMYQAGAMGLMDMVTDDFIKITGHEPESMLSFLTRKYRK